MKQRIKLPILRSLDRSVPLQTLSQQQRLRSTCNGTGTKSTVSTLFTVHHDTSQRQQQQQQQQQHRTMVYLTSHELHQPIRRIRKPFTKIKPVTIPSKKKLNIEDLQLPYEHGEQSIELYLQKTSLSPWVPIPDSAARKMMDMAQVSSNDVHVDLGCGDGRVNFYALDYSSVQLTIGIDIDEHIIAIAHERLQKRHPIPTNIQFEIVDLLTDLHHPIWEQIQHKATVITMYFATEALHKFKPVLESKLNIQRKCKIITAGYAMPGWIYHSCEVVNALPLYLYEWGTFYKEQDIDLETSTFVPLSVPTTTATLPSVDIDDVDQDSNNDENSDQDLNNNDEDNYQDAIDSNDRDDESDTNDNEDDIPLIQNPLQSEGSNNNNKLRSANVIDRTNQYNSMIRGYNPNYKQDEEEWDYDWDNDETKNDKVK